MRINRHTAGILLCGAFLIVGSGFYGAGTAERASAEGPPAGIELTAEELNAGTTAKNPWKKMFDFWSDAGTTESNVLYTADGVVIEGTNKNNAMNFINAPMSVTDGARFEMVFNIPLYAGDTGELLSQTPYVQKAPIVLFNGATALTTAYIWGDSYSDEQTYVKADFEVGATQVTEAHIPKAVMEEGEGIKIGFDLEKGWYCDMVDGETTEYRAVSDTFAEELAKIAVREITRVQVTQKWDTATNTKIAVKELNGQNFRLGADNTLFLDDGYNVSALKTPKDFVFLARKTYTFELLGVKENSTECNTKVPQPGTAVWAYAHTGIMGDIGWNADGSKGPEKNSGIYLTLTAENGSVVTETFYGGSWGNEGQPAISFSLGEPGKYTLKATFITATGVVTVRTAELAAQETPHILLDGELPTSAYIGTNIEIPGGRLVDADGVTVLVEKADVSVLFSEEPVETTDGTFAVTAAGKYTLLWTAEHEGESYRKSAEVTGIADAIKIIEITQEPQKTRYTEGESFDRTGMIVTAVYESGKREEISDYTVDKDVLQAGDKSVVIGYEGKKTVVPISVAAKTGSASGNKGGCGSVSPAIGLLPAALVALFCMHRKYEK